MTTNGRAEGASGRTRRSPIATAMRWAVGLALAVAVLGVLVLSVGTFTGWLSIQTVPTGSMEPTIHKGSVIVVDPIAVDDVEVGDIIVFAAPETGRMTVHRVATVEYDGDGRPVFTTRGDANNGPDPWRLTVDGDHLHQVRYSVPVVGSLLLRLSDPTTRLVLTVIGAALVLGFGLHHVWRKPTEEEELAAAMAAAEPQQASDTWHAALERVLHLGPHHSSPAPIAKTEATSIDEALDDADDRRIDALGDLVLPADPAPSSGAPVEPSTDDRKGGGMRPGATTAVVLVGLVLAGALALPVRSASASFAGTTQASAPYDSLVVPPKTAVTCSWDTATSTTVSWTNPNGTDSAQVLVATTSGGSTTVGATAAAGATSVVYSPATPLTTPKFLSTKAVDSPWTSVASAEMPTNTCRRAINLFAGAGTASFTGDGGAATAANLNAPMQTAEAADGSVYIADSANNRIRKVSPAGVISTFAGGTGGASACTYTGVVTSLRMSSPRGVAVDASGNVYIADTGANCIRKVDTGGNVTRVAGGGATTTCGTTTATAVSLSSPTGLDVDASGNVYVADTGRNCIRMISTTGSVTRVAGGGATTTCGTTTATAVSLSGPLDVDVDSSGDVYVADTGRNCIRKVVGTTVTAVAGGGGTTNCASTVAATSASLSAPQSVAVDAAGTVYVADTGRRCVRQVVAGTASQVAFTGTNSSSGDGGPALGATARTPSFLTVLADGDLLVSDRATNSGANDVRRVQLG
jgi:signal peptidase I